MGVGSKARSARSSRNSSPAPSSEYDPAFPPNIKRSLTKNDTELAALSKLHVALRTLKETIVNEYGDDVLVECVLNEKKLLSGGGGDGGGNGGDNGMKNDTNNEDDEEGTPEEMNDKQKRLKKLSTAFLLRMKLRRRLLNRLARRLHRVAHILDGGPSISAPLPPQYGDVARRYVTEEAEKRGVAKQLLGSDFDNTQLIREKEVMKFINDEDEKKDVKATLDKQRSKRLGLDKYENKKDEEGEALDDLWNQYEKSESMDIEGKGKEEDEEEEEVEQKSDVDLLLQADEEDKPLLDKLVEYEPGYDKVYSAGPLPPLPSVTATSSSPTKKSNNVNGNAKKVVSSPSAAAEAAPAGEGKPGSPSSSSKQDAAETTTKLTMPIASTIDDHEVDDEGEFLDSINGTKNRLPFSLFGNSQCRTMHPMERATEWKRWTKEMCDKIPDQVTYDELGVGGVGMVFDLEERLKRKRDEESKDDVANNRGKGKVLKRGSPEKAKSDDDVNISGDDATANRGKGKVLKKSSPEKAKSEDTGDDMDGDVKMSNAGDDSKTKKSDEEKEGGTVATNKKDQVPKASTKTFSVTPVPSFHYQDLRRIRNLQSDMINNRKMQLQHEDLVNKQAYYDASFSRSLALQREKAKATEEYQFLVANHRNHVAAISQEARKQHAEAVSHWKERQVKLKTMKDELGEEQAFNRELTNDVLQDLKDRVCIRASDKLDGSGLGTHSLKKAVEEAKSNGDLAKEVSAIALGHMIDTVERRYNDMLANHTEFVPPITASPKTTVMDLKTGESVEEMYERMLKQSKNKLAQLEIAFKAAEEKRGTAWSQLNKAKAGNGGQDAAKAKPRSRKSTGSNYVRPNAAPRQSYPVQMMSQPQPGYVPQGYYQPQPGYNVSQMQAQAMVANAMGMSTQMMQQAQAQAQAQAQYQAQYRQQQLAQMQMMAQQQQQRQAAAAAQGGPAAAANQDQPSVGTDGGETKKQTQAEKYG